MRISSALGLCLLAGGCGQIDPKPGAQTSLAAAEKAPDSQGIPCAQDAKAALEPACTIDRTPTQDGTILTIRHPDGGFRRLKVTRDGHGVIAADGAEPAKVTIIGPHEIEVALAGERYRLPATVGKSGAGAP